MHTLKDNPNSDECRAQRAQLQPGTGVWFEKTINGRRQHVPGVILGFNRLSGCYLVAPEADPMRGHLVGCSYIRPRYAGEAAPGVTGATL